MNVINKILYKKYKDKCEDYEKTYNMLEEYYKDYETMKKRYREKMELIMEKYKNGGRFAIDYSDLIELKMIVLGISYGVK